MKNILIHFFKSQVEELCNFTCITGLFGIVGSVIAVMAIVVAMFVYPWSDFSWDVNSISSLGAVGPTYLKDHVVLFPEILDYGLMVAGVLLAMFSLGLLFGRKGDVKDTKSTLGSIIFFISSVGVFGVGFFPLPDLPDALRHGISAMVAFVGIAVALFFFFRKSKILPTLAGVTGLVSLVGIVLLVIVYEKVFGIKYGLAAPEMVIIIPVIFWVIPVSITMIKGKLGTS